MSRIKSIFAGLALAGMASVVPGVAVAAQSGGSGMGSGGGQCQVVVRRNADSGVFDVARYVAPNGNCSCLVSTGPRSQGGSAESAIAALQMSRSCADAPLVNSPAAASGGGGMGAGLWIGLGLAGAGGLAAALSSGGGSSNSP